MGMASEIIQQLVASRLPVKSTSAGGPARAASPSATSRSRSAVSIASLCLNSLVNLWQQTALRR